MDPEGDAGLDSLELHIPPSYSMQNDATHALGKDEKSKDVNSTEPQVLDEHNIKKKGDTAGNSRRYSAAYTVDTDGNMDSLFNGQEQDNKAQRMIASKPRENVDNGVKDLKQSETPENHMSRLLMCLSTRVHIDLLKRRFLKKIKYVKNTIAKDVDDLKELLDGMELNPASPILETFLNNEKHVQGDRHIFDAANCDIPLCKAFNSDRAKFIAKSEAKEKRIISVIHDFIEDDNSLREDYEERLETDIFNPANQRLIYLLWGIMMDKTFLYFVVTAVLCYVLSQAYLR